MTQCIKQNINIGSRLREFRRSSGYTQRAAAEEMKTLGIPISREIYAQIEMGRHHIPVTVLVALHGMYGFSYDELFNFEVS